MNIARYILAAGFGGIGLVIIVSGAIPASSRNGRNNPVTVWVANFSDYGLTPGLVLLCTGVILLFLHHKRDS